MKLYIFILLITLIGLVLCTTRPEMWNKDVFPFLAIGYVLGCFGSVLLRKN